MQRIMVVSADGHFGGSAEEYRPYIDPAYRERLDELVLEEEPASLAFLQVQRQTMTGIPGAYEPDDETAAELGGNVAKRLSVLDTEGISAEILLSGTDHALPFFGVTNKAYPADVRAAGVRAYHRWTADVVSESDGRLLPVGYAAELDLDEAVTELQWLAEHGFVAVSIPLFVADPSRPRIFDRSYDRFWAACADLGLVVNMHVGWDVPQGPLFELFRLALGGQSVETEGFDLDTFGNRMMEQMDANNEGSPFALELGPRQALWQLMLSGVFDRHPSLRLVLTELRADWVPATLAYLDQRFAEQAHRPKLSPSEYFARNCGVTPSSPHRVEIPMRHEIGIDQFMFGADIPHPESTWPHTRQWIRNAFAGVPEPEARKILGENAVRIYNLDGAHLADVASRIGPTVEEVFAGVELEPWMEESFQNRAGYLKPVEQVDVAEVAELLDTDFARVGTSQPG